MFTNVPIKAHKWTLLEPVQSGPNALSLLAYFNNNLQPTLKSHRRSVPFLSDYNSVHILHFTMAAARPAQLVLLSVVALIIHGDLYTTKLEYSVIEQEQRQ